MFLKGKNIVLNVLLYITICIISLLDKKRDSQVYVKVKILKGFSLLQHYISLLPDQISTQIFVTAPTDKHHTDRPGNYQVQFLVMPSSVQLHQAEVQLRIHR